MRETLLHPEGTVIYPCLHLTFQMTWASLLAGSALMLLQAGNVAAVRQYQEAIIVNLMLQDPDLLKQRVLPALLRYETR